VWVAGAALLWAAMAARQAGPIPLTYFNELAGTDGTHFLADSNADWGQGLPALRDWMAANNVAAVQLGYFGTDRPEAYGIRFEPLPGYGRVGEPGGEVLPPGRRVVVVSVNLLCGLYLTDPDTYAALRQRQPIAVLAGSLWVFEVSD
jgi:hypothetical protein